MPDQSALLAFQAKLDDIELEIAEIRGAFPRDSDGYPDHSGHRRYHEAKILAAKAEEAFWVELRLDIAKKGTWVILCALVGLIFVGLFSRFGGR